MKKVGAILSLIVLSTFGTAQTASMVLDNPNIRIGEQTTLHILFEYQNPNEDALIGWPQLNDQLTNDVEIVDRTIDYNELIDSSNFTYLREQKLVITAFEEGRYTIPAVEIELNDSIYATNSVQLFVTTVEVDTSKGIVDIKPNYQVDYTLGERTKDWLKENWIWFLIIALLIAIYFGYKLYKNSKKEEGTKIIIPKIPAHITALKVLNDLQKTEEWKSENKKEFYSKMTDTIRLYLEERFAIYAMEQTTREILSHLKKADISEEDKEYLKKILTQADMVKFAKFKPNEEDGKNSLNQSIGFVEKTKKEEEENE